MAMPPKEVPLFYTPIRNIVNNSFSLLPNGRVEFTRRQLWLGLDQAVTYFVFYFGYLIKTFCLGLIAACWASMMYYGRSGYVEATKKIAETHRFIERGQV